VSEKVGGRVSRGAINESLEALDTPENRQRLGRIINSPQMRDAIHDLAASIVLGVFDGVREARKTGTTSDDEIGQSIRKQLDKHVTPAVGRLTYRVVGAAVSASLTDKHIAQIEKLAEGATHGVIRGVAKGLEQDLGPALAATIDKDLGPALAVMISRDIMPAVGRGLDTPEMQSAVENLTRSIATGMVGGAGDAIDTNTEQNEAEGKESGLQLFGDRVAAGYAIAVFLAFALATMLVVLTVVLVRSSRRQRKQSEQAKRREEALLHLIDGIESDHPELRIDVRRLVQEQLHTEQ
jgi:heme exporter protein D